MAKDPPRSLDGQNAASTPPRASAYIGRGRRLARAGLGGLKDLEGLFRIHQAALADYARRHIPQELRGELEPQDVVQDTFTDALGRWGRFIPENVEAARRWLMVIASHQIINALKAHRAEKRGGTRAATGPGQNGSTHTYTIDPLGRTTADSVTTLGSGVDGTVRQLAYAYNDAGLIYQDTSYATSSGGSVVNQEQDAYNGFQQLITQYQAVSGSVNTSTTPAVGYNYNADADGQNNSKLESEVYPNGRVEDYDYGQGQEPVTGISVSGTTATVTTAAAHGLSTGTQVDIEGSSVSALDGLHTITYVSSTQFSFTVTSGTASDTSSTDMTEVPTGSLDFVISRPDGIQDHDGSAAGTVVQSYTYLGLGTIVQETNGNNTELTYIQQSPAPTPTPTTIDSGGDRYSGLDRFGRVDYQNWITTSTGAQIQGDQYGYDADNNVLYDDIVGLGSTAASWSQLYHASSTTSGDDNTAYDPLNRVTQDIRGTLSASGNNASSDASLDTVTNANINTAAGSDQTYTLDAVGNWTSSATAAGTGTSTAPTLTSTSRTANSQNELTAVGSNSMTEDNNGNVTKDQAGNTFTYDAWNRPMSDSAGTTSYRYLPGSDRAIKTSGSCCSGMETIDSYYTVDAQVLEDYVSYASGCGFSPHIQSQYVWGLDYVNQLVERDDNSTYGTLGTSGSGLGERIYPLQDANYNVRALTSNSGGALQYFVYDAYGNATVLNTSFGTAGVTFGNDSHSWIYGFQGGRYDVNTGLYRFGARDYSPVLGRWMEQDGGYWDGSNLYQGFDSDPVSLVDPFGFAPATAPTMGPVVPQPGAPVGAPGAGDSNAPDPYAGPLGPSVPIDMILSGLNSENFHARDRAFDELYEALQMDPDIENDLNLAELTQEQRLLVEQALQLTRVVVVQPKAVAVAVDDEVDLRVTVRDPGRDSRISLHIDNGNIATMGSLYDPSQERADQFVNLNTSNGLLRTIIVTIDGLQCGKTSLGVTYRHRNFKWRGNIRTTVVVPIAVGSVNELQSPLNGWA